ncbi:MAG: hypothetical protein ACXVAR_03095 [Vulcanimicrobiaceae bacterium]
MKISIMSRVQAERYRPDGRAAIISITDADPFGSRPAGFEADWYAMVHREQFDDIHDDGDPYFTAISWVQAERIAAFIQCAHESEIDELVIHCEAGISRSAGIAVAACSIIGIDDEFCYEGERRPNPLVRDRVLRGHNRIG